MDDDLPPPMQPAVVPSKAASKAVASKRSLSSPRKAVKLPSQPDLPAGFAAREHKTQFITKLDKQKNGKVKTVNGLIVKELLGVGGFGKVKLAENSKTGEKVALKKMKKFALKKKREFTRVPGSKSPKMTTALDKVYAGIDLHQHLWHPNVVALKCVIDDAEAEPLYTVLELCSKGQIMDWQVSKQRYKSSLHSVTKSGGMPENVAFRAFAQAARGLLYLKAMRVVHRDIKPDNLLVDANNIVRICDFDVSRGFEEEESTLVKDSHGTHHFYSPEICQGIEYDAFSQDAWALGVTLHAFCFGTVPWMCPAPTPEPLFDLIAAAHWEPPKKCRLSQEMIGLLQGVLERDPAKRMSLEDAVAIADAQVLSATTTPRGGLLSRLRGGRSFSRKSKE